MKQSITRTLLILFLVFSAILLADASELVKVDLPHTTIQDVEYTIKLSFDTRDGKETIWVGDEVRTVEVEDGSAELTLSSSSKHALTIRHQETTFSSEINPIPLWFSILPPLIAIIFALLFKEVYLALFAGIFTGAFVQVFYATGSVWGAFNRGMLSVVDTYIVKSVFNKEHIYIIVFSMLIGGVVSLITKNGGMIGLVNKLSRYANTSRKAQLLTYFMGIFIFFDDYANTLVVGNTMRSITDKFKVSREKLAYIVDSTAAPMASIALVTTWIGAELSYIEEGISAIGLDLNPYSVFLSSLKYAFYPILTLVFMLFLILSGKDFGPMKKAQNKQLDYSEPLANKADKQFSSGWWNGVIPVLVIIVGTLVSLVITGKESSSGLENMNGLEKLSTIIGNSDSYMALLWSSLIATVVTLVITIAQKLLNLQESMDALLKGYQGMLQAILVLVMAWALSEITKEMHTAEFISNQLIGIKIKAWLLPACIFLFSLLVSFATGSSWGTMAILYPLIIPATWMITQNDGLSQGDSYEILFNAIATVLTGSVLGDHISPISDTTVMSSLASGCNHIDHVKTQTPYALVVGAIALLLGTVPSAFGVSVCIIYPLSIVVIYLGIRMSSSSSKAAI